MKERGGQGERMTLGKGNKQEKGMGGKPKKRGMGGGPASDANCHPYALFT
jgi:hypothetical protein